MASSNVYIVPVLISSAVVLVIYMMKKDEDDVSKRPNYPVLYLICLALSGGIVYFLNSGEDPLNVVMKEVNGGTVPF